MSRGLRALFRAEAPVSRESTQLEFLLPDGARVPLLRVRDRRARRLRLTVSERGVRLSVPWRLAEGVASAFVRDHAGWIAAQWQRLRVSDVPLAWGFGAIDALPLAGVEHGLEWNEARSARIERIEADGDGRLRFHAPRTATPAALRRAVLEFYAAEARAAIHRWLPAYLSGLPRPPRDFRIRPLQSLWGSLSPDGRVSLDLSLALGAPAAFEYVLVHELCHLVHANHSAAFWREVELRCSRWREVRNFLRSDGGLGLKAQLRSLAKA
jgi:hypothetical protein